MQERPNSPITRVDVWIRAHTKKDGTAINEDVVEKLVINSYMIFSSLFYFFGINNQNSPWIQNKN